MSSVGNIKKNLESRCRSSASNTGKLNYNVNNSTASITVVLLLILLTLFVQSSVNAQDGSDEVPSISIGPDQDRDFEKRAQNLETQLICPICPGETLDQSFVQISQDMKRILREKLISGQNEQQIKDFFVARYGNSVLAAPPKSGFNLLTWIIPPIAVASGVVVLLLVMRQMRKVTKPLLEARVSVEADPELTDYLAEVDRDLALEKVESNEDKPDNKSTGD